MSKAIVVFSDGTGNSAAKLFKTNVWRLYQALDVSEPTPDQRAQGAVKQVAYYDDGVGTSSFKPLALLGGAFGVGLRRNVLDLYRFLCFSYEKGDRIYAFGFSRGAFTVRVLIGLVVTQGLIKCDTGEEHDRRAVDAYRAYRRRYAANQLHIVRPVRWLRDRIVGKARRRAYAAVPKITGQDLDIAFVGVWDTVSAYGMPVAELTRGIDKYVWPLSMPNYTLSPLVKKACHALALDDERDTFHPLLWDEVAERDELQAQGLVQPGRLEQVWFAGMHSDVGGGYPDDGLSYIPLEWMMTKAEDARLRFSPAAADEIRRGARESGPIHDSRRGLGGYYRYQPRKIAARIEKADPTTVIMRDPDREGQGLLTSVKIHESVLQRIRSPEHDYAPIVLPADYEIVPAGSTVPREKAGAAREARQEWVWNDVWRRRISYFTTVGVSLLVVAVALANSASEPSACDGPLCVLTPLIASIGAFLPGFLESAVRALARSPEWLAAAVLGIYLLQRWSGTLQRRIGDGMAELWLQSFGAGPPKPAATAAGRSAGEPDGLPFSLRTHKAYLRVFQWLKWKCVPAGFGALLLTILALGVLLVPPVAAYRLYLALAEVDNYFCTGAFAQDQRFETSSLCWPVAPHVTQGQRYRVTLTVHEAWRDEKYPARPAAPFVERMPGLLKYGGIPIRRYLVEAWFQPMIRIIPDEGTWWTHTSALVLHPVGGTENIYTGEFVAARTGRPYLFVNDAMPVREGPAAAFYRNNQGTATVTIAPVHP